MTDDNMIIKHSSTIKPDLNYDDRLTQIEQAICNITLRPKNSRHKHYVSDSEDDSDKNYRRHSRNDSDSDDQNDKYRRMTRKDSPSRWKNTGRDDSKDTKYHGRSNKSAYYNNSHNHYPRYRDDYYRTNNDSWRNHSRDRYEEKKKQDNYHQRRQSPKADDRTNYFSQNRNNDSNKKYCHICSMSNHNTTDCGFNGKVNKRPAKNKSLPPCEHCLKTNHTSEQCFRKNSKNANQPAGDK